MKHSLLAAAFLSLSSCAPLSEPEVKTPLVDIGSSGINLEATLKAVPIDSYPENKISTRDKIEAILKELKQPGDYRMGGIDLSSKNISVQFYFEICDKNLRFDYCLNSLSLMIYIADLEKNSEIFLVDSPPYGTLDYFDFCKNGGCKIRPLGYQILGSELLKRIVDIGYRQVIDENKKSFIDSEVETIFQNLTEF
ncbi:MAG: hypothetical protein AABX64_02150 [Nanoarchaeota archaeon]